MKHINFIINPDSGRPFPILKTLNDCLKKRKVKWDIFVTKKSGDAHDFARFSIAEKVDALAVYGGDGTIMEVATALEGENTPLVVLPGGSANVLANELKIPQDIRKACDLFFNKHSIRNIDVASVNGKHFLIRLSSGFEAEVVREATPDIKTKIGWLAYGFSGLKAALKTRPTVYNIRIDGKKYIEQGLSCIVANSGNLGLPGVSLSSKIKIDDGLVDVILVNYTDLKKIFSGKHNIFRGFFKHWQAREVEISMNPAQNIQCDGEEWIEAKIKIKVIPKALRVVVG